MICPHCNQYFTAEDAAAAASRALVNQAMPSPAAIAKVRRLLKRAIKVKPAKKCK